MTPTVHSQNHPILNQHLSKATGLLKILNAAKKQYTTKITSIVTLLADVILTRFFHEMLRNNGIEQ